MLESLIYPLALLLFTSWSTLVSSRVSANSPLFIMVVPLHNFFPQISRSLYPRPSTWNCQLVSHSLPMLNGSLSHAQVKLQMLPSGFWVAHCNNYSFTFFLHTLPGPARSANDNFPCLGEFCQSTTSWPGQAQTISAQGKVSWNLSVLDYHFIF